MSLNIKRADGRLRAGWRILLFLGVFYLLLIPALVPVSVFIRRFHPDAALSAFLKAVPVAIVATIAVMLARPRFDKRSFVSLGLERAHALGDTIFGFALSASIVGLAVATLEVFGMATINLAPRDPRGVVLTFVGTAAAIAWWEELVLRGYVFRNMLEGLGTPAAVSLASLIFGLMHAFNPHAGVASTIIITGISFMHVFGYLRSGQLWIGLGMHAGWNFFQGGVFGMSVSGRDASSILITSLSGPSWATGGAFGIEASVFGLLYVVAGIAAIRLWCGRIVPRPSLLDGSESALSTNEEG